MLVSPNHWQKWCGKTVWCISWNALRLKITFSVSSSLNLIVNLELLMKSFFCDAYCLLIYHYLSSTQQQNKYKKIKSATIVMQSYTRGWKVYHWTLAILRGLFVKNMQNAVVANVMAVWWRDAFLLLPPKRLREQKTSKKGMWPQIVSDLNKKRIKKLIFIFGKWRGEWCIDWMLS